MGRKLAIATVNYRTPGLVVDCLRSISAERAELSEIQVEVAVVDSGSGDGSAELLQKRVQEEGWGDWVEVIALPQNGGFSAGNNAAISMKLKSGSPPDYFLLLNPDTQVRPGALSALVDFAELHPQAGIVGSRLEEPDGTPQRSAFRFHSVLGELDRGLRTELATKAISRWIVAPPVPEKECRTEWVSGASMLVRREVFEQVGLLDEGYFLYYEEVDFCLRAARKGWECWYEPRSRVVHLVGQATGLDGKTKTQRLPDYVFESRRRFFLKNYGKGYTALADSAYAMGYMLWCLRVRLQGREINDPPMFLRDFFRHSVFVRGFGL